ncbi:borealin-2 [Pholidichthys leucotaenia]
MPLTRARNAAGGQSGQLSREMRRSKLALFIQQFEQEAHERLNELNTKMENMLSTVDKAFKVELLKMPPSLQNTLISDVLREAETSASEVSIAIKNESCEIPMLPKRMPNRRGDVKSTDSPDQSTPPQRSSTKPAKGGKWPKRTGTLVGSNSAGNLGSTSATVKRTVRCPNTNDPNTLSQRKPKLRSVVSTGDLHCSVGGAAAHITVTTGRGQMVSFSEEMKDEINLDLLDDVAWCQIQKLTGLMEHLSQRSRCRK